MTRRRTIAGEPGSLISVFWLDGKLRVRQGSRVIDIPAKDAIRFRALVASAVATGPSEVAGGGLSVSLACRGTGLEPVSPPLAESVACASASRGGPDLTQT